MDQKAAMVSWSGGKDCCHALYKAMKQGFRVERLVNFMRSHSGRCCFHGIDAQLMATQARALGIPLFHGDVKEMDGYEEVFKKTVSALRTEGIKKMVFGDIYLDEHREWVERVCAEVDVEPLEPLWNLEAGELARDFVAAGFKTIIVSCRSELMGKEFLGRMLDEALIEELERMGICPCGENGEYHTLVIDGPIFEQAIEVLESERVHREGHWPHWSFKIKDYRVVGSKVDEPENVSLLRMPV